MPTRNARRKAAARIYLVNRDINGLLGWIGDVGQRAAVRLLVSLLFDPDESVRWRAVEGLGRVAAELAVDDPERVRVLLRNLFWSMNDESGSLIRFAPQAIGEVLFRVPVLRREYARKLAAFRDESPFEEGVAWALERIAHSEKQDVETRQAG